MATYAEQPHGHHGWLAHLRPQWVTALKSRWIGDRSDRGAGRAFKALDRQKAEAMRSGRPLL